MSESSQSNAGGFFVSGLVLLFIGLKLTGYVGWSWWWILSPFWFPAALALAMLAAITLIVVACLGFLMFIALLAEVFG